MIEKLARDMIDPLTSCVAPLNIPMTPDHEKGWKPNFLFQGSTGIMQHLSCHASVLVPGHSPHPPHTHDDEEILMMLSGEADLIFPDSDAAEGTVRHRLKPGQFVYYPSGFAHTLEAAGSTPANYLMIRWMGPGGDFGTPLPHNRYETSHLNQKEEWGEGFQAAVFFKGPTSFLRKLESHLSVLKPGAGYDPHADNHDVIILVLEGEVETLGQSVTPYGAIFYRAGEPHGMKNTGDVTARYLVFEFHGNEIPMMEKWPLKMMVRVARKLIPGRIRKRIGRLMGRIGRKISKG